MPTYLKVVVPTYFWCQRASARVFWWSAFLKPLCKNQFQFLKLQWQTQLPKMKICLFLIIAVFCVQDVWGSVGLILLWIYKCIHISKSSSASRWKWNMLGLPIIFHRGSFTRTTTLRSYLRSNNWLCCWRPQHLGFHKAFQKKKRCRWKWKIIWRILDCKGFETRRVMEIFHWWHILSTKKEINWVWKALQIELPAHCFIQNASFQFSTFSTIFCPLSKKWPIWLQATDFRKLVKIILNGSWANHNAHNG